MIVRTSSDFSFGIPGEYHVKLLVTDANGNSGEDEIVIIVEPELFIIGDDGQGDDDREDREKGGGVSMWVWLIGVILVVGVIVVLVICLWKERGVLEKGDEYGRVMRDEGGEKAD